MLKIVTITAAIVGIAGLTLYLTPNPSKPNKKKNRVSLAGPFEGEKDELEGIDPLSKLKQRIDAPRIPLFGFQWYYNSLINVFTLVPNGWEVDDKKDGNPCFDVIPKERNEVGTYPRFSLFGMMIDKKKGVNIESVAQGLSKSLQESGRKIERDWVNSTIPTERNSLYATKDLFYTTSVTSCITELIYNPLTETIYVVQFEGPTSQWTELLEKYGNSMIGSVEPNLVR